MKTQISRYTYRASARYSGVQHQQGRMIVDADLNEQSDIVNGRLVDALHATVLSGAPAGDAGLALKVEGNKPVLVPGRLYVDGLAARLPGKPAERLALNQQPDYPNAPTPSSTDFRIYADVWERSVTALEDEWLMDAGLHGADTATRSQTMLQVKTCPSALNPQSINDNPPRGNAPLSLTLSTSTTSGSGADPCAANGQVNERIGNYLFRVEVHDVYTKASQEHLVIKWSRDNGAESCRVGDEPPGFTQNVWAWEFFDTASEQQAGLHPYATTVRRGVLVADTYKVPGAGQPQTFARQWDGYADINLGDNTVTGRERGVPLSTGPNGQVSFDTSSGRALVLALEWMTLKLGLRAQGASSNHVFVPGDYWLACVREAERDKIETEQAGLLLDQAQPSGITHHYLELGRWDGTKLLPPDGLTEAAWKQRMAFRPLTDLQADGVSYQLPSKLVPTDSVRKRLTGLKEYNEGQRITMQAALDALGLNLDAGSIPYATTSATPASIADLMVKKTGDTMSGDLTVNATVTCNAFKLIAPAATPDKAVLTYEKATGLAKWLETALTAWRLNNGNLSTDPGGVTGSITIGTPPTPETPPLCVAAGKVGIGTNAPNAPLHIVAKTSDTALDYKAYGQPWLWGQHIADGASQMWGLTKLYGRLITWDSDSFFMGMQDVGTNRKDAIIAWGDDSNDLLRFMFATPASSATATTAPAPVEVMQLRPDGALRVGGDGGARLIGNAALGAVFGQNILPHGRGTFESETDEPYAAVQASEGTLAFHTSAGNIGSISDINPRMVIDAQGNVGIGTTPTERARLVVDGDIYVTGRVIQGAEIMALASKELTDVRIDTNTSADILAGTAFLLQRDTEVTFSLALLANNQNTSNWNVPLVVRRHRMGQPTPDTLFQSLNMTSTGVLMQEVTRVLPAGFHVIEIAQESSGTNGVIKTLSLVATEKSSNNRLVTTVNSPTL